jgi:cobalamin biosynthesis protein CobT
LVHRLLSSHELLIEEKVRGKSVSVMDDAMTYRGEQYAIVLRLLDDLTLEASTLLVELGHWATSLSHTRR